MNRNEFLDNQQVINALTQALKSQEHRLAEIAIQIEAIKAERQSCIDSQVMHLLPNITNRTLDFLQKKIPTFVDANTLQAFNQHHKVLGLIPRPGYTQALHVLQSRLANFIEASLLHPLPDIDEKLEHIMQERAAFQERQRGTSDLLRILAASEQSLIVLPRAAQQEVRKMAKKARLTNFGHIQKTPTNITPTKKTKKKVDANKPVAPEPDNVMFSNEVIPWYDFMLAIPQNLQPLIQDGQINSGTSLA